MRHAQLRLRQVGTVVAIAVFVAAAAIANVPRSHSTAVGVNPAAGFSLAEHRAPAGIRWRTA